jgi:hypothetical protein
LRGDRGGRRLTELRGDGCERNIERCSQRSSLSEVDGSLRLSALAEGAVCENQ